MEKRVTIKDVAKEAGVSLGAVHCALKDKPGVGADTRENILRIAKRMGYRPNSAAVSLKRKTLRVAALFPGPNEESRFYFNFIWEGVRDWFRNQSDLNIELVQVPFYSGTDSHANEMNDLLEHQGVDGLITTGETDTNGISVIRRFADKKIPIALVSTDIPDVDRLCCVLPDYEATGRVMAELLHRQIGGGSILLCAGGVSTPSHYLMVRGFEAYFKEKKISNNVYKIHPISLTADSEAKVKDELAAHEDIAACAAVNARGSLILGQALSNSPQGGRIPAVANDMFRENLEFLKTGIFSNLINKKPYYQAYTAAKYITDYLLTEECPPQDTMYVGSEVFFQSNLLMYMNGYYGLMR